MDRGDKKSQKRRKGDERRMKIAKFTKLVKKAGQCSVIDMDPDQQKPANKRSDPKSRKDAKMYYTIDIAGLKRDLKLFPISDDLQIAAFILFGDVEITRHAASKLLEKAPEFDVIITAEAAEIHFFHSVFITF